MLEYELFFRYSMDMYVIAANDGYFKRANPAFCNILGRSEAELLSRPFAELVHPDDLPKVDGVLKNLSSGHPTFLVEVRLLASDGTGLIAICNGQPTPTHRPACCSSLPEITARPSSTPTR